MSTLHLPGFDLSRPLSVHIIGIGGAGMSAIASVLASMGHTVTGSDLKASAGLERLAAQGVTVTVGHAAENLATPDIVAVSTAIPERNPELAAARNQGIAVLRRAEILSAICAQRKTLAVAGTHGKTTTSSMLALILLEAGVHPSFIIGGDVNEIGTGAVWSDEGELFVVEADESDGTFLELPAWGGVVTNVESDHLDHYGSIEAMRDAFERFIVALTGPAAVGIDLPWGAELAASARANGATLVTFGQSAGADYHIANFETARVGASFDVVGHGQNLGSIELAVPGAHNASNAAAALALALEAGISFEACQAGLARFTGVARRFQFRGEAAGVSFVDDYAHLPSEVAAVIEAARHGGWQRVVVVFQPHRYSRIAALWQDFAGSFTGADKLVITDIYGSGEQPRPGVTGRLVVDAVLDAHAWTDIAYLPHRGDVVPFLVGMLRPGDLCLTLGAGDLTSLPDEVIDALDTRRLAAAGAGSGGA